MNRVTTGRGLGLVFVTLMLITLTGSVRRVENVNNCPMEQEILPCQCRSRGRNVLLSCRRSTIDELTLLFTVLAHRVTFVEELMLEENDLSQLPPDIFGNRLAIQRLLLWNNGLERLDNHTFNALGPHLKELHIREPRLTELPDGILHSLSSLEKLIIEHTPLTSMPRVLFCVSLNAVHLDETKITELGHHALFDLPQLTTFQLTNSLIEKMDHQALSTLPRLEMINMTGNMLSTVKPTWFHRLPQLRVVDFRSNSLKEIHPVLELLRLFGNTIQILHLDRNQITSLSTEDDVFTFPRLNVLTLSHNQIENPAARNTPHQNWGALRQLDLSHNKFSTVPAALLARTRILEELNMAGNPITKLEENFRPILSGLPYLRSLSFDHCKITDITQQSIGFHPALEYLSLRDNGLRNIEAHSFHGLPALAVLNLQENQLSNVQSNPRYTQRVPNTHRGRYPLDHGYFKNPDTPNIPSAIPAAALSGVFWELPSLRALDISQNQLDNIDSTFFAALPSLRSLNISRNSLTRIETRALIQISGLETLDISNNLLDKLDDRLCQFIPNLERLNASVNQLGRVESGSFHCYKLRILDVSHNNLSVFSENAFHPRNAIQFVDLSHNSLNSVPDLRYLGFLKTISLSANNIDRLHVSDFQHNLLLEHIDISWNQIKKIPPESFARAHHLRTVDLSHNKIQVLVADAFRNLMKLDKLDLSYNNVYEVEAEAFHPSSTLRALNLAHNSISHLSTDGIALDALQILDLRSNQISDLSYFSIRKMRSLSELDLSYNHISTVHPKAFENSRALIKLDLSNNQIESLSSNAFWSLPNLQTLRLSRNRIQRVETEAFYDLLSLESLDLEENVINQVDPEAFHGPSQLRTFNLSNNEIERIEDAGVKNLLSLEVLDLSNNYIKELDGRSLRRLVRLVELNMDNNTLCRMSENSLQFQRRLQSLSLRNNRLGIISESVFQHPAELVRLDLGGNPLQCDCRMLWLYEKAESRTNKTFNPYRRQRAGLSSSRTEENELELVSIGEMGNCFEPTGRLTRSICSSRSSEPDLELDFCPRDVVVETTEIPTTITEESSTTLEVTTTEATTTEKTTTTTTTLVTELAAPQQKQPETTPTSNTGELPLPIYAEIRKPNGSSSSSSEKTDPGAPSVVGPLTPIKFGLSFLPTLIGVGSLVSGLIGRHSAQGNRPAVQGKPEGPILQQYDYVDVEDDREDDIRKPNRGPDLVRQPSWLSVDHETDDSYDYLEEDNTPIIIGSTTPANIRPRPVISQPSHNRPYIPLTNIPPPPVKTITRPSQPWVFVDDDPAEETISYDQGHWLPPPTRPPIPSTTTKTPIRSTTKTPLRPTTKTTLRSTTTTTPSTPLTSDHHRFWLTSSTRAPPTPPIPAPTSTSTSLPVEPFWFPPPSTKSTPSPVISSTSTEVPKRLNPLNVSEDGYLNEPVASTAPSISEQDEQSDTFSLQSLLSLFQVRQPSSTLKPSTTTPIPALILNTTITSSSTSTTTSTETIINITSTEFPGLLFSSKAPNVSTEFEDGSLNDVFRGDASVQHNTALERYPGNQTEWFTTLYEIVEPVEDVVAVGTSSSTSTHFLRPSLHQSSCLVFSIVFIFVLTKKLSDDSYLRL